MLCLLELVSTTQSIFSCSGSPSFSDIYYGKFWEVPGLRKVYSSITLKPFTFGSQILELHSLLLSFRSSSRVPFLVWCLHMLPLRAVKECCSHTCSSTDIWMYTVLLPCAGPQPAALRLVFVHQSRTSYLSLHSNCLSAKVTSQHWHKQGLYEQGPICISGYWGRWLLGWWGWADG